MRVVLGEECHAAMEPSRVSTLLFLTPRTIPRSGLPLSKTQRGEDIGEILCGPLVFTASLAAHDGTPAQDLRACRSQ